MSVDEVVPGERACRDWMREWQRQHGSAGRSHPTGTSWSGVERGPRSGSTLSC